MSEANCIVSIVFISNLFLFLFIIQLFSGSLFSLFSLFLQFFIPYLTLLNLINQTFTLPLEWFKFLFYWLKFSWILFLALISLNFSIFSLRDSILIWCWIVSIYGSGWIVRSRCSETQLVCRFVWLSKWNWLIMPITTLFNRNLTSLINFDKIYPFLILN